MVIGTEDLGRESSAEDVGFMLTNTVSEDVAKNLVTGARKVGFAERDQKEANADNAR